MNKLLAGSVLGALAGLAWGEAEPRSKPNPMVLTYNEPAKAWTDALPVGNGSMGAMVFGGTASERIQFNHDTLWAGEPRSYSNPEAHRYLPEIRHLLFGGKQAEAERLAMEHFMSRPLRQAPYQPFGDVHLDFPGLGKVTNYHRELDLDGEDRLLRAPGEHNAAHNPGWARARRAPPSP